MNQTKLLQARETINVKFDDELFTVRQAAIKLNFSEATVRRLIKSGELPHFIRGRNSTRIARSALNEFITRNTWTLPTKKVDTFTGDVDNPVGSLAICDKEKGDNGSNSKFLKLLEERKRVSK